MFEDLLADELEDWGDSRAGSAIGIDLGTTNSVVASLCDGQPVVLPDRDGSPLHPSVVSWLPNDQRVVGSTARARRIIDPRYTVYSAKRIIGQPFDSERVQGALRNLPYRVTAGRNQEPLVSTREGEMTVPQISAFILEELRGIASQKLGRPVTHCVVTVPANFSDGQRAATRRAAELAGMEVLRVLNEPTAAAIAYCRSRRKQQRIAVFDFGGGTFDLTLLAVRDNVYEVIATGGDPFLGGDDIDSALADCLAAQFLEDHRLDLNADPGSRARLLLAAEQIKQQLTRETVVEGSIGNLAHGVDGVELNLPFIIQRCDFEEIAWPTIERTLQTAERVLSGAGVETSHVDEVILVGGSTRIPLVKQCVAELFGRPCRADIDPMVVVAKGAAIHAQGIYAPGTSADVLLDVTPHDLRLATAGGFTQVLIEKNTTLPAEGLRTFTTSRDGQTAVDVRVSQGDAHRFDSNVPLGELRLDNLPPRPRGQTQIDVAFTIDADGILHVSAEDVASGKETTASLTGFGHSVAR